MRARSAPVSLVALVTLALVAAACGGAPPVPTRGVVEGDLGRWHFRRYQPVLDVEVWVDRNPAEAFTASYVTADAEKRGRIDDADLVNAFVTRYQDDAGVLRELVKFVRRLAAESGYQVEEAKVEGVRLVRIAGNGETWVMWAARRHVIKLGGRARDDVPADLIEAYGDRYPSTVPGGVLEGPLPPGPDNVAPGEGDDGDEPYDEDNPRPDWEGYRPGAEPADDE
ncbi:MAG: hypothetical protein R2939_01205 [Kofleriaceae bacterium]